MSSQRQQLESAIAALQAQRELLGDEVTETALAPLRAKLAGLADTPATDQALRQVTILFLDVVGSTTLAQRLDAEDMHAALDGLLADCTAVVEKHQGKVLQYAGDNLLAVFGAAAAREDDAERAVHAGLALLAEGRRHAERIAQRHGHCGLDVRVGVHTGNVLLGGGVDAEHTIRGNAVHIAARMEQTAPPGTLRISHDTYRHVRGVFDAEAQPPIEVKGVDDPLATYLVERAKPRAFRVATRGIEGVETRMIGRDAELAQLQDAFLRVCSERKFVSVTVVGDAGVGKSRLLYEFENWAEARPEAFYVFQGRAHPQTQNQPYGLLRDVLAWRFEIADSDSMQQAKQKFERGIVPLFEPDDGPDMALAHAHVLGHLIGLDFGESRHIQGIKDDVRQIRNRGFHAAAQVLRRFAAHHASPVVLLLDDLHFADDASLDFLRTLGQLNRDVPILMLGLARPTLFERRPDYSGAAHTARRIELAPLAESASRSLVNELLKKLDEVPAELRELVTAGGEGNPFYMEELVKMLIDVGAIDVSAERWTVAPDRLVVAHIPHTLVGVLQARLDELASAHKLALQYASVIGFVFWGELLASIDSAAPDSLPELVRRELVVPRPGSSLGGMREYTFKHHVLHQVAYDTVLKRDRRDGHAKVAAWLAEHCESRPDVFLGATAEHFEKAGNQQQACEFFARAAEHANGRMAHEATMNSVARALEILSASAPRPVADGEDKLVNTQLRWRLLDVRERTLDVQGRRTEQRADIAALQALADDLDDDRRRADVAWRRSDIALRLADYRAGEAAAREAMNFAERAGDRALYLRAQLRLSAAVSYLGDTLAGKALAQDVLTAARSLGLRLIEALALSALTIVASIQDDLVLGLECGLQKLPIDRELGNLRNEATTLNNLGNSLLCLGDQAQARDHLQNSLRLTREVGDRSTETYPLNNLSVLALRTGELALAHSYAKAALEIAVDVQNRESESHSLCLLGNAELALGRPAAAAEAFERAHTVAMAIDNAERHSAAAGIARAALASGSVADAMLPVERLLAHLAGGGTLEGAEAPRLVQLTCYQVLDRAGDPRATAMLEAAHSELQSKANTIADRELRNRFLRQIPENLAIVQAWSTLRGREQPGTACGEASSER